MDSSPPSEVDYAERMTIESNKMDIEIANQEMEGLYSLSPVNYTVQQPPWNKAVSNNGTSLDPPTDPITPSAIPLRIPTYGMVTLDQYHCLALTNFYKATHATSRAPSYTSHNSSGKGTSSTVMVTPFLNLTRLGKPHSTSSWPSMKPDGTNLILRTIPPSDIKSRINLETIHQLIRKKQKAQLEISLLTSHHAYPQNKLKKSGND